MDLQVWVPALLTAEYQMKSTPLSPVQKCALAVRGVKRFTFIVVLELLRRDYRVYIGKFGETEIDFVAEKPDDKIYIQVTESMQSPETRERELRPLRMIPDNYEKIVLSMDRNFIRSYDGTKSLNLIDWLFSE